MTAKMIQGVGRQYAAYYALSATGKIRNPVEARKAALSGNENAVDPMVLKALKRSGVIECSSCASRKYVDGSDEDDVTYKTPSHISPSQSSAAVAAHESMHVTNAHQKAAKEDGKLLRASVNLEYAICPECGRRYCAGGETNTSIRYKENRADNEDGKRGENSNGKEILGAYVDIMA